jgi:hypothetical protein
MRLGRKLWPLSEPGFFPTKTFGDRQFTSIWRASILTTCAYAISTYNMVAPTVTLTHLNRADGSATYTYNGYSIIGAVNGPIDVQRRDELPEEAAIEVNVRPAMGVGST